MSQKNNTIDKAAALKYDGKNAPKLVAKGSGVTAKKIIQTAQEHNVHIHNDPMLLEVLSHLELDDEIPKELYLAVAKVIAFAYFLQGKHPNYQSKNNDTYTVNSSLLENENSKQNKTDLNDSNNENASHGTSYDMSSKEDISDDDILKS